MMDWPDWAAETIEMQPPDTSWELRGERERELLQARLGPWLVAKVEHVGSTAFVAVLGSAARAVVWRGGLRLEMMWVGISRGLGHDPEHVGVGGRWP